MRKKALVVVPADFRSDLVSLGDGLCCRILLSAGTCRGQRRIFHPPADVGIRRRSDPRLAPARACRRGRAARRGRRARGGALSCRRTDNGKSGIPHDDARRAGARSAEGSGGGGQQFWRSAERPHSQDRRNPVHRSARGQVRRHDRRFGRPYQRQWRDPGPALHSAERTISNRHHNAGARTAPFAAASGPRYISINNAFGRPWIANAPNGADGEGSVSVVDPDGAPLANAPSRRGRRSICWPAYRSRAYAESTAQRMARQAAELSGKRPVDVRRTADGRARNGVSRSSPDGSGFAVFAAVTADGSVVQIHVQDGVDGLAAPSTVSAGRSIDDYPGVIGIAFKWNPDRVLYIADPGRDRLVLLELEDDRRHFTVARTRTISLPGIRPPGRHRCRHSRNRQSAILEPHDACRRIRSLRR